MNPEVAEWRLPSPALSPEAKEWSPAAAMFVSVEAVIGNQVCEGEVQKVDRGTTFADVLQCTRAAEKEGLSRITDEVKVKIKNSLTERSVYVAELNWPVMEVMQAQGMLEGFACSNSDCPLTGVVSFSSVLGSPKCFIMVKMDMWKCNGVHPKAHIRRAAGVI